MRDLFAGDFVSAQVDNERTHKRIVSYLKKTSPHMIERVHRYKEKESLFESSGVEKEIASTLDRRVDLPSGGYLVFDYAEAFTVIDVNTGRFVGSRSKNSNQRLEDTITKNNLEAVKEVVRQLRLRDIGGIIVIDFIDMANPKNRASVEDALRDELERDRTKTYVVEISPLGLVEMTRQNVTDGPREILTRKCPTCAGDGIVVSDHTVAMQVERKLRALASPGQPRPGLSGRASPARARAPRRPGRSPARRDRGGDPTSLLPRRRRRSHPHRSLRGRSPRASSSTCSPPSTLAEGSTVEIKLGEVGRYDATAGAGKLDGVDVLVADAAKLVGKKATVTIGRVLDGQAFATLVAAGSAGAGPITFESEAEKPTRAPAKRKASRVGRRADEASIADDDTIDAIAEADAPLAVEPEDEDVGRRWRRDDVDDAAEATVGEAAGDRAGRRRDCSGEEADAPRLTWRPSSPQARRGRSGCRGRGGRRRGGRSGGRAGRRCSRRRRSTLDPADDDGAPTSAPTPKTPSRRRAPRIHVPGDPTQGAPLARGHPGRGRRATSPPTSRSRSTRADGAATSRRSMRRRVDGEAPPVEAEDASR